jgi:serine/threonine protein kinase
LIVVDLKPENILVTFEDPSVLLEFVELHSNLPQPRKIGEFRTVYQSRSDLGELKSFRVMPMIADLGLAQRGHNSQERITPIQTDCYRAPEVILGADWTYSTDIWNLGVLVRFILRRI